MKKSVIVGLSLALLGGVSLLESQEPPSLPQPQKEHAWLAQLAGDWESDVEVSFTSPPIHEKSTGTESARMVGGFWLVADAKSTSPMNPPWISVVTLGYDQERERYVGTAVDSMTSHLWQYEGTLDAERNVLTLTTEGPCPLTPGRAARFRETIEIKDKDHKIFTSFMQSGNGEWERVLTVTSVRKK
jgi:hypothetical protein